MPKVLNKYKAGVPHGAVYCGRGSPYGNPFVIGGTAIVTRCASALSARCCRPWTCPALRGKGIGKALLVHLAKECVANGWSRLQWSVLDWNTPSIEFYKSLGAVLMDEWTVCGIGGPALTALAQGTR